MESVANVLCIAGVDNSRVIRRLAPFPAMLAIETALKRLLAL
jgi:hypothetical protein